MASLIILLTKAWACGDRISSVLDIRSSQEDGLLNLADLHQRGSVSFENVSLRYAGAGAESLEHVSFSARPG